MSDYLYGVDLVKPTRIEKILVLKETAKQYQVEDGISAYGHRTRIGKDDPMLAWSEREAVEKYVAKQEKKIARLVRQKEALQENINKARGG